MTVTIFIAAESPDEMSALITEGAPEANMSYSTFFNVACIFDLYKYGETDHGECEPEEWLEGASNARAYADTDLEKIRVEEIVAVARAAQALGRRVRWG